MADHFHHGRGSSHAGGEPDIMSLPPRIRPFDPERYDPPEHVLPPTTFYHFTDFERQAPADLLLREPESHLSHQAREVSSHSMRGYGSILAREWYAELPDTVRHIMDEAGFGLFCAGLSRYPANRTLMGALVERWWDTTNSFHFSAIGDMTMTPFDFAMLTGLDMAGRPVPYDVDMGEGTSPETVEEIEQYAWGFLMFLFGTTLFSDRGNTIGLYLLSALVDLSQVSQYDWGDTGLATLYCYMSATSRGRGNIVSGYWRAWEVLSVLLIYTPAFHYLTLYFVYILYSDCHCSIFSKLWVYAYFPTLAPELEVEAPLEIPYSRRFEGRCRPRTRETLPFLQQFFDTVQATEFVHLLSADHLGALDTFGRRYPFLISWAVGLFSIPDFI
ncbi:hypothetical protein CsSME_00048524 [Camellia sinensis var. sinensis]